MSQPPLDAFDEAPELAAEDLAYAAQEDGTVEELVVLAEVEHDGAIYGVLATHDQLTEGEGDLLVARLEDVDGRRTCFPVLDDATLDVVQAALSDLLDLDDREPAEA